MSGAPAEISTRQEFDQLRTLLVGPETSALDSLERKIQALEAQLTTISDRADFMAAALPESIDLTTEPESRLHRSLLPKVEQVVHTSVRRDPNIFAEALYPVMGPLIRKIVHKLFDSGKRSQWSPYNVEQLFVIHRGSGLVISHQSAPGIAYHDADMVSGMLDAVRSFVQEAFDSHEFDGLRLMTVGDVNVRIEWSPYVVLAAVVRGVEPENLRPALESTLSDIHQRYQHQLQSYSGESEPYEGIGSMLNNVLTRTAPSRLSIFWMTYRPAVVMAAVLLLLAALIWMIYGASKWNVLLDDIGAEPGVVVINQEHGLWNNKLQLLKDPYAESIDEMVERNGYDLDRVEISSFAFYSNDEMIRLKRAANILSVPAGVELYLHESTLYLVGNPGEDWLENALSMAPVIEGVDTISSASEAQNEWTTFP